MIRFKTKDLGTVTIKFRHHLPNVIVKKNNDLFSMVNNMKIEKGRTECFLRVHDEETGYCFEYFGVAYTHPADHYNKETGRKLSLERAIESARFTPAQAREIMAGYYSR